MDHNTQQYLDMARAGLDVAQKTGVLNRIFGLLQLRQPSEPSQPIEQPDPQIDFRERALKALQENAVETLASLELTIHEAIHILGPEFSFEDLNKVNSTWQRHWMSGASNVGVEDEDRHAWWGRLVAGEIQQPGTFSLRTLAVMDTLSTEEAQLFTKLCSYAWNPSDPVLILPSAESSLWNPDFSQSAILESIGLVKFDTSIGFQWGMVGDVEEDMERQRRPFPTGMQIDQKFFFVMNSTEKLVQLRCGHLMLTDIGKEMYRLTSPEHSQLYLDEMLAEWRNSYEVLEVPRGAMEDLYGKEIPDRYPNIE